MNPKIGNTSVVVKHVWFPCFSQLAVVPPGRVSYLYSLWVGLSTPLLNLPRMLWMFICKPVLYGLLAIFAIVTSSAAAGLAGRAVGAKIIQYDK